MLRPHGQEVIPDTHIHPEAWGIRPVLFTLGGQPVSSYAFFVALGLVAAIGAYYLAIRRRGVGSDGLYIALAAAVGGILGSKIPIWIANLREILTDPGRLELLLSGRTIVGGIVGGALAVYLTKKRLGITRRLGNHLVAPLCIGIFFGRIGCFLAGCCYGRATSLPWGVDFGDGMARHPTQLYEALFVLALLAYALAMGDRLAPGELFGRFMIAYFAGRFAWEFIRVNPASALGLTYYQIASLGVIAAYSLKSALRARMRPAEGSA